MDQHISIRMRQECFLIGNFDTTQNDAIALAEGMHIKPVANSQIGLHYVYTKPKTGRIITLLGRC